MTVSTEGTASSTAERRAGRELLLESVFRPLANLFVPAAPVGEGPAARRRARERSGRARRRVRPRSRRPDRRGGAPAAEDAPRQPGRTARARLRSGHARRPLSRHAGRSPRQRGSLRGARLCHRTAVPRGGLLRRAHARSRGRLQRDRALPGDARDPQPATAGDGRNRRAHPQVALRGTVRARSTVPCALSRRGASTDTGATTASP